MKLSTFIASLVLVTDPVCCHRHLRHTQDEDEIQNESEQDQKCHTRRLKEDLSRILRVDEWPNNGRSETRVGIIKNYCDSKWDPYFNRSVSEWNSSPAIQLQKKLPSGRCDPRQRYIRNNINLVDGYWPRYEWDGLTTVQFTVSGNKRRIVAAIVAMNNYHVMNSQNKNSYDANRRQTMCHELGHAIGLKHPNVNHWNRNTGSCMDYSAAPEGGTKYGINFGPANTRPSTLDYKNLKNTYLNPANRMLNVFSDLFFTRGNNDDFTIVDETTLNVLGEMDMDDIGELILESRCRGVVERTYEKIDEESGIITSTMLVGLEDNII